MDPLSLSTLQDSLPASSLANAEKELLSSFKAAALSITTLYRSSRSTSKRAYNAGYISACRDLLAMIQQSVSDGGASTAGPAMDVGRVMDWVDARVAAIRDREEEEEEDEEKERERQAPKPPPKSAPPVRKRTSPPASQPHQSSSPPPPSTPTASSSRPFPSAAFATPTSAPPRTLKPRLPSSHLGSVDSPSPLTGAAQPIFAIPLTPCELPISIGQKRRHALLSMPDAPSSAGSGIALSAPATPGGTVPGGLVRRRTRSSIRASGALGPSSTPNTRPETPPEMMDVEEEGRERKRVARR